MRSLLHLALPVAVTDKSPFGHHGWLSEGEVFAGGHLVGKDHWIGLIGTGLDW